MCCTCRHVSRQCRIQDGIFALVQHVPLSWHLGQISQRHIKVSTRQQHSTCGCADRQHAVDAGCCQGRGCSKAGVTAEQQEDCTHYSSHVSMLLMHCFNLIWHSFVVPTSLQKLCHFAIATIHSQHQQMKRTSRLHVPWHVVIEHALIACTSLIISHTCALLAEFAYICIEPHNHGHSLLIQQVRSSLHACPSDALQLSG